MTPLEVQRALYRLGFDPGGLDGVIGPKTRAALVTFAAARCVAYSPTDPATLYGVQAELAHEVETLLPPFVQARNFTPGGMQDVRLIVIHTAEAPEIHREAVNVANFFAMQPAGNSGSSAHYVVDDVGAVQCVLECDRAWHAGNGYANAHGIGIEHAGYASQSPAQWNDDYSKAVLANSAKLVAALCRRFNVPIVKLAPEEVGTGRGLCGHVDVTNGLQGGKGHVDPGPCYPWPAYLDLVRAS